LLKTYYAKRRLYRNAIDRQIFPTKLFLLNKSLLELETPCGKQFGLRDLASRWSHRLKAKTQTALRWIFKRLSPQPSHIPAPLVELKDTLPASELAPKPDNMLPAFQAAYVYNCTYSSLHNLPVELVLQITAYLPPVARLIMQRVCSKFRAVLAPDGIAPELKNNITTVKDVLQLTLLLRRGVQFGLQDDYDRNYNLATLDRGCSGCRITHEVGNFSAKQLSLSHKTRICKGLEASFQLCEHFSFSGQCLLRGLREIKNADLFCEYCDHDDDIYGKWIVGVGGL